MEYLPFSFTTSFPRFGGKPLISYSDEKKLYPYFALPPPFEKEAFIILPKGKTYPAQS